MQVEKLCGHNGEREIDVLLILDLGLPDMDGVEVTLRLREWSQIPVIIVSVREQEEDKIAALDAGADDYLTKPFGAGELLARIRVVLHRSTPTKDQPVFETGELRMDISCGGMPMNQRLIYCESISATSAIKSSLTRQGPNTLLLSLV